MRGRSSIQVDTAVAATFHHHHHDDLLLPARAQAGPRLLTQLHERFNTADWTGFARLVQRISIALLSNSYRDDLEAWKSEDEGEAHMPDVLPPSIGHGQARKPYFEVLVVTPGERSTWAATREGMRKLRRDTDEFVYEPVMVGSFEDAMLATLVNYNIQAVVLFDGFGYASQHPLPDLRELMAPHLPAGDLRDAESVRRVGEGVVAVVTKKRIRFV